MAKRRIGPFQIEKQLGTGGMGVVYLATYLKSESGQKVALKVLTPALSVDEQLLKRFEREMEILKKLRHEHIVRYYGGGRHGTQHYYAMELMGGGSLEGGIKKQGRLTWEQTVDFAMQIAKALEYSHYHAIIHRDLKPANCFLSKRGKLKLGDYGIARDTQATALTAAGKTVGTYSYMAPEQISGKPPISRKTDLYALGCVMFEMLTGKPPFQADTPAEMLFNHLKEEPPRVTTQALDCPVVLESIIDKLLEKDPEERYFDALALQVALGEVGAKAAEQQSITRQTVAGGTGTTKFVTRQDQTALQKILGKKKKKKRKQGPIYERGWFLGLCLLILVGGIAWMLKPLTDDELIAGAEAMMESGDSSQWGRAEEKYLIPLLEAYPESEHIPQAQEYLDEIWMERAERQALNRYERGKPPKTEAERHFFAAKKFEAFGDRITALQQYRSLVELFQESKEDRPFVNLARRQIASIEQGEDREDDRIRVVNKALLRGDEHLAAGRKHEAVEVWNSVIALYGGNREFEPQVNYARARVAGDEVQPLLFDENKAVNANGNLRVEGDESTE